MTTRRMSFITGIILLLTLAALSALVAGQQAAVTFLEPVKVPHGSDIVVFEKIGPVYFGSDTDYEERKVKRYIDRKLYGRDAKTNDYRLVIDTDPILCQANIEVSAAEEQYRVPSGRLTALADITDKDGTLVDSGFAECSYQSYLDNEKQRACVYRVTSFKALAGEKARGNRFTCTMKFLDDSGNVIAQASSQKPAVVADVNYHVTTIANPAKDYGNILEQYDWFVEHSGVRAQETLDNTKSKEALGKLVFYDEIELDPKQQFRYVSAAELGYTPTSPKQSKGICILDAEHPKRVRELLGIDKEDFNRKKGDAVIAVSDTMLFAKMACVQFAEGSRVAVVRADEGVAGSAAPGEHYVVMRRHEAPSQHIEEILVLNHGQTAVSLQPITVRTLAHELNHALEFHDKGGNIIGSVCDEYSLEIWTLSDLLYKKGYFGKVYPQGCPNRYPPCCTEAGGNVCSLKDPAEQERICLGMPIGYEGWTAQQFRAGFEITPDKEFSIMGYGDTIPVHFPAPLPKVG